MTYEAFLRQKELTVPCCGISVDKSCLNPMMFEWQKDIVVWALKKGKAGLFEDCGLGKTIQQLEWCVHVSRYTDMPCLIVAPLAVSQQTKLEGQKFGYHVNICRNQADVTSGINITNYEILEHFEMSKFGGIVLDESSILKHFDSKIRTQIIEMCRDVIFKLSCTATPAPNDFMELGSQAEFLGVMTRAEMLATFFVHDGGDTSKWRIKRHAEADFWAWLAKFAVVLTKPSDLGYEDAGYTLPELNQQYIVVSSNLPIASTLSERRNARRASLVDRCKKASELVAANPNTQWLIWCDLNAEADELVKQIREAKEVRGSDPVSKKESLLTGFSNGTVQFLITKPSIAGFGLNWQRCSNMIFVGLSDSYEMMYQAIRRCWRFGQDECVNVYTITSWSEGSVKENIHRKELQCEKMMQEMVSHTQDILAKDVRGTVRMTESYEPKIEMVIPAWITGNGE